MKKYLLSILALTSIFMVGCGKKEKIYEIGKDLEAGEYVLIGTLEYKVGDYTEKNYGYYAICTTKECNMDTDANIDEIIKNDNVVEKAYVILEDGQYLKTKGMKLYKVDEYNSDLKTSISYNYNFGHSSYYKVGKDLSAGTYELSGTSYYYAICSKPSCDVFNDEIIKNEFIDTEGQNKNVTITVENGQYLIVSGTEPFTATKQ